MKTLLTLFAALSLIGCANTPSIKVAESVKSVPVEIPSPLLRTCEATPPPNKQEYLKVNLQGREDLLIKYAQHLLLDLKNCDDQLVAIKHWQIEVGKLYVQQHQGN
jgi:hypothetical protein